MSTGLVKSTATSPLRMRSASSDGPVPPMATAPMSR